MCLDGVVDKDSKLVLNYYNVVLYLKRSVAKVPPETAVLL